MQTCYTYDETTKRLHIAPNYATLDGAAVINPTREQYARMTPPAYPLGDTTPPTPSVSMAICGMHSQRKNGYWRCADLNIHEVWIKKDGVYVRHYYPATMNGVAGLWDEVSGTFNTSVTNTSFTPPI